MKNIKLMRVSTSTLVAGIICMLLSVALPTNFFASTLGGARIGGVLTLYFCPILGLIGLGISVRNKNFILAFGNFLVILAFPIMMFVVGLINI